MANELFELREQVNEFQYSLLDVALQIAAGRIPTPHIGSGLGRFSSDLPWNDNDKDRYNSKNTKVGDKA